MRKLASSDPNLNTYDYWHDIILSLNYEKFPRIPETFIQRLDLLKIFIGSIPQTATVALAPSNPIWQYGVMIDID